MGGRPTPTRPRADRRRRRAGALIGLGVIACAPGAPAEGIGGGAAADWGDVAPLLHGRCAGCHHGGEGAPFPLLTYADAAPRASRIADAVGRGAMPPWLPVAGYGEFEGERRLAPGEAALLARWARAGAPRGPDPEPPPPPPSAPAGWGLGEPDLVVEFPPYPLPSGGVDVYRNLVVRAPVAGGRWVRAVEVDPGHRGVVHHARMMVDSTASSRTLDAEDVGPGFDGMDGTGAADDPPGFFVGWTPGKAPFRGRDDLAWWLGPDDDLVLQLHLRPSKRPEAVRPRVGLHFAPDPPRREPVLLVLEEEAIDIPAGEAAYVVEDRYRLPVPVEVLGVYPHAHYLGRRLHAWAELPDGSVRWLVRIDDWDFDWQDEYRFTTPPRLPAGALLALRYTFDNSAANPRNPSRPPVRVRFGPHSTDEMAELALQLLPADARDAALLRDDRARSRYLAASRREAAQHAAAARELERAGRLGEALEAYRRSLRVQDDPAVMAAMADIFVRQGEAEAAVAAARQAVAAGGDADPRVLAALARAYAAAGRGAEARAAAERAAHRARALGSGPLADSLDALARRVGGGR